MGNVNSNNEILFELQTVIEYYKRMPDAVFLLHEAYIDKGFDKKGIPDVLYKFEILDYCKEEADKHDIEDSYKNGTGICNLSSEKNPGKKYCILNGKEISERAERLQKLLEAKYFQPPGIIKDGTAHIGFDLKKFDFKSPSGEDKKNVNCNNWEACVFRNYCPKIISVDFRELRLGSIKREYIKTLQAILFKFWYGDEMRFEKYKLDGRYGKRTSLAVENFIEELNFIENKNFNVKKGEIVNKCLFEEIEKKCENNWERKCYYHFMDEKWDLSMSKEDNELTWLRRRYHVRQLQSDLEYFTIVNMTYLPFAEKETGVVKPLNLEWEQGKYDKSTDKAVSFFVDAASVGIRYYPLNNRLEYTLDIPTYQGKLSGPVDGLIKTEIQEWFKEIENLVHFRQLFIDPDSDASTPDLSSSNIINPMMGTTVLVKENNSFNILLSVPKEVNNIEITADLLKKYLPYYLFIHKPVSELTPFASDLYTPSYLRESKYFITEAKEIDHADYMFYKGTKNVIKSEEYKAKYIDSGPMDPDLDPDPTIDWDPEEIGLKKGLDGMEIKGYTSLIEQKIKSVYDGKYEGLLEKEINAGNKIWDVHLLLSNKIKPGIYLLKVKMSKDKKPHPVKVFDENKETYNILHLTDLHIAERFDYIPEFLRDEEDKYNNPNDRLRDVLNQIKDGEIDADFVILTGDVVDNSNNYRPYDGLDGEYIFKPIIDTDKNWRFFHSIMTSEPGVNIPFI